MKRNPFTLLSAVLLLLALAACGKQHECKCTFDEELEGDSKHNVFTVDGIDCAGITEMALEHVVPDGQGGNRFERYEVRKITCRDHGI
ncbi:MAG: hypothetical protein J6I49_07870 [Bacteroidales bacterium]|nr:hypothetical protein [Bacteroidales bacterium]